VSYASYLGGSGDDSGFAVHDSSGALLLSGDSSSAKFSTAPGYQLNNAGKHDLFVPK